MLTPRQLQDDSDLQSVYDKQFEFQQNEIRDEIKNSNNSEDASGSGNQESRINRTKQAEQTAAEQNKLEESAEPADQR